jgi:hypothetical protein
MWIGLQPLDVIDGTLRVSYTRSTTLYPDIDSTHHVRLENDVQARRRLYPGRRPVCHDKSILLSSLAPDCAHLDIIKITMNRSLPETNIGRLRIRTSAGRGTVEFNHLLKLAYLYKDFHSSQNTKPATSRPLGVSLMVIMIGALDSMLSSP